MNNQEYMKRIVAVINALNTVEVKGQQNLASLSGSISVLEELASMMQQDTQRDKPEEVA